MKFHPAAEAFPMMDKARLESLKADIHTNGLRVPIVLCDGMILDGRNRATACEQLGITPDTTEFTGDPWAYVWSLNGQRRDLSADQRAQIWLFCNEHSEAWKKEQTRIAEEANRKRSEAMQGVPYAPKGESRKPDEKVVVQSVQLPSRPTEPERAKSRHAAAQQAEVNAGAIARAEALAKARPDLAEKVRAGEMRPAAARRQVKMDAIIQQVKTRAILPPTGLYDVIVIDPPWPMEKIEREVRPNQVAMDYPTMTEEELNTLYIPANDNCHIWLWTTHRFLPMALRLLDRWGLKYVCTFVWHKPGGFQPVGLPQYNAEFALYARKGSPIFTETKSFNVCFDAPRGAHSEKPNEFYDMICRVTHGRRLDMFNRRTIDGFDGWGSEAATHG